MISNSPAQKSVILVLEFSAGIPASQINRIRYNDRQVL